MSKTWIALAMVFVAFPSYSAECKLSGDNKATKIDGALAYATPILKVDADGAPGAYRLDGKGLSYTCDGVVAVENGVRITPKAYPKTWQRKCQTAWTTARTSGIYKGVKIFGFETNAQGQPLVQKDGDPLPGEALITTTSVNVAEAPAGTQRRYVDAMAIPFLVLPGGVTSTHGVRDGAVAAVWRAKTNKLAYAVYGDGGGVLDEASIRLHQDLGGDPLLELHGGMRAKRNIEDRVVVVLFPQTAAVPRLDAEAWRAEINQRGRAALASWGGAERLRACRP